MKLYRLGVEPIQYWETWEDNGKHIVHWGDLGTKGQTEEIQSSIFKSATSKVQKQIDERVLGGFVPVDPEDHRVLMIEYRIDDFGSSQDLDKRHRLEDRMNETLGWTGLGACDGGSSGSGTMEVCCFVVDFEIAKSVVENDLAGTEFSNYSRIYDELAE